MIPEEALELVLQRISTPERLRVCALVHSSWHAAAGQTTSEICTLGRRVPATAIHSLSSYMSRFGGHITTLRLRQDYLDIAQPMVSLQELPCQNLKVLDLADMTVQLSPDSRTESLPLPLTHRGVLATATKLTQLVIWDCALLPGDSFAACTTLPNLKCLVLKGIVPLQRMPEDVILPAVNAPALLPGRVLAQLTSLTRLYVDSTVATTDTLVIGRLTQLQFFGLMSHSGGSAPALGQLQVLKRLEHVRIEDNAMAVTLETAPGLHNLTGLKVRLMSLLTDNTRPESC